jgi:para-aminobenzoate synthetase component I
VPESSTRLLVEFRPVSPIGREAALRLIDTAGAALFEGWSDDGSWILILPWPERILELSWPELASWPAVIETVESEPPVSGNTVGAPFAGGWIGFLSYEAGAASEGAPPRIDAPPEPPVWFSRHRSGIAVAPDLSTFLFAPPEEMEARERELTMMTNRAAVSSEAHVPNAIADSLDRGGYCRAVEMIRSSIAAGDVYQVNLTRRFRVETSVDARELYLAMTGDAPPQCSALIRGDGWTIVSASPEVFLRFDGRVAESRPIKGTISRAGDDAAEIEALLSSEKDESEHLMIVDLVRNDFSRVARAGSVTVPAYKSVRSLRHVHHMESTVRADGLEHCSLQSLLAALFPAGSITGAPKRAAVETIRRLEPVPRGVYTGAIGFVSSGAITELSVAIRTAVVTADETRYHAGGGIVWDSDPESEDAESRAKSVAFLEFFGRKA